MRQVEARLRAKEEEVFQVQRDRQGMERDIQNLREIEKSLK